MEEEWREFAPGYTVSNMGNVRGPRGPLKPNLTGTSPYFYIQTWLSDAKKKKNYTIHRLVALAFVKNPRPDIFNLVDHIDLNIYNNHHTNLRWLNNQLNGLNNKERSIFKTQSGKWKVQIRVNYKLLYFGTYTTEAGALAVARREKARIFHETYVSLVGHTDVNTNLTLAAAETCDAARQPRDSSAQLLRAWLNQSGKLCQPREGCC